MFRIIVLIVVTAITNLSYASSEACETNFKIAEMVMKYRQDGYSIIDQYEVLEQIKKKSKNKEDDGGALDTMESMIISAYEQPRYSSVEYQESAVKNFADHWFLRCKKARY